MCSRWKSGLYWLVDYLLLVKVTRITAVLYARMIGVPTSILHPAILVYVSNGIKEDLIDPTALYIPDVLFYFPFSWCCRRGVKCINNLCSARFIIASLSLHHYIVRYGSVQEKSSWTPCQKYFSDQSLTFNLTKLVWIISLKIITSNLYSNKVSNGIILMTCV
jgi:hypothetical protein